MVEKAQSKNSSQANFRMLHVAFTLHDPMINQWLIRFLKKTKTADAQIDLMTTADEAAQFQEAIENIGGNLIICPHPKNKGAFLRFIRETFEAQDKFYDVVHIHPFIMAGEILMQAFRANIPTRIVHAHADRRKKRRMPSWFDKIKLKRSKILIQRLATHGVAPNDDVANDIFGNEFKADGRWKIMPYGLNVNPFDPNDVKERRAELKQKLCLPQSSKVIAQIAPFNFEKNHDLTLQIFAKEAQRNLSLYLILQGQGPLEEKIKQDVAARGLEDRVIMIDNNVDHADILSVSDLLILPSLHEHDISILIEAQLHGTPCLISNEIEQGEYLKNDLVYSLTLEGGVDLWVEALHNIIQESDERLSKGESLKGSPYDIDINAGKFLGLYEERRPKI